ncbi:hypothetical protein HY989_05570 [Candidatus Micrarchaeota archaeon]|nr:hypothetical protein [Candidatus Micrarchaeota archaeon]
MEDIKKTIETNAKKLKEFELGKLGGKLVLSEGTHFELKTIGQAHDLAHVAFGIPNEKIRKHNQEENHHTEELVKMFEKISNHVGVGYFKASAILAHILKNGAHDANTANRLLNAIRDSRNKFGFNQTKIPTASDFYLGRGRLISHLNLIRKIYELSDDNGSHTHGIIDKEVQRAHRTKMFDRH